MKKSGIQGERLVGLFMLAVLLINPPLILIFDRPTTLAGLPILYLYLFVAWAALIALLVVVSELVSDADLDGDMPDPGVEQLDLEDSQKGD